MLKILIIKILLRIALIWTSSVSLLKFVFVVKIGVKSFQNIEQQSLIFHIKQIVM